MGFGWWFSSLLGVPGEAFCRLDVPTSTCPSHGFIATTLFPRSIFRHSRHSQWSFLASQPVSYPASPSPRAQVDTLPVPACHWH